MKIAFALIFAALATAGCAYSPMKDYYAQLVNDEGKIVECNFSGFGIMMGQQAHQSFQSCVANAQMNGFVMIDD